jgi:hypothetical protein
MMSTAGPGISEQAEGAQWKARGLGASLKPLLGQEQNPHGGPGGEALGS